MCRLWIKQEYTSCVGSEQHGQSLLLCFDLMMDRDNTCVPETSLKLQQESDRTLGSDIDNSPILIPMVKKNAMDIV